MPNYLGREHQVAQIRDIARELGAPIERLLHLAAGLGLRVSCPSSVLTIDQAEQLESVWRREERDLLGERSAAVARPPELSTGLC